jgi:hypothetical protein
MTRCFALLLPLIMAAAGQAEACPNPPPNPIVLIENGPAVHVSLHDQTCNQITPASASQFSIVPAGLNNCAAAEVGQAGASPAPSKVVATADSSGVALQAVLGATGMAACTISVQFKDGTLVMGAQINVSVSSGVTAVNLESP